MYDFLAIENYYILIAIMDYILEENLLDYKEWDLIKSDLSIYDLIMIILQFFLILF